jgi:hypothetical protein
VKTTVWPGEAVCEESSPVIFTSSAKHRPESNKAQAQKIRIEVIRNL